MCDECSRCHEPAFIKGELRLIPDTNEIICCDCWDAPDWGHLKPADDLPFFRPGAILNAERRAA